METREYSQSWLVADIGATSSRCALLHAPTFRLSEIRHYRNDDAADLQQILKHYLAATNASPANCALAVAAPIDGDEICMMNRVWRFSQTQIGRQLGFDRVKFMNDFHAVGFALPHFNDNDRAEVGNSTSYRRGNIAALGPGSGLGMSAWIEDESGGSVMSGEGGHITVSGRDEIEDAIILKFRERFGHCSAERILSGPGIIALHSAMHDIDAETPEEISTAVDDPQCAATMSQFFKFLGSAAADLALITGAFGGVYIAGGIVPCCVDRIRNSEFRSRFDDKNRYGDYMRAIPTWVITDPTPGLTGLSVFVSQGS